MPPIHHPRRPAPARRPVLATVRPSALSVGVGNRSGFSPRLVARWPGSWLAPGWSFNPVPAPIAGSIFLPSGHFTENVSPATALAHPAGNAMESVAYDLHLEVTEPAPRPPSRSPLPSRRHCARLAWTWPTPGRRPAEPPRGWRRAQERWQFPPTGWSVRGAV